jgi:ParB-like chromosome segregation protein Spo0J
MQPELTITYRNVDELIPYGKNARTHSTEQIKALAEAIANFGWTMPILINREGGILAGHGRLEAARLLGMTEVPTIQMDHLTPQQQRAFILAENKLHERSSWDKQLLVAELKELKSLGVDLSTTGFDVPSIEDLLATDFDRQAAVKAGKVLKCPYCGRVHDE